MALEPVDPQRLAAMRGSYEAAGLEPEDLAADWLGQLRRWLAEAVEAGLPEPNAMVLATADAAGRPSARNVLLKLVDARGFVLYTNLDSRKGRELAANPWASVVFPWIELHRQVVVTGSVEPVSAEEADAYFASRPRGSQLGAAASPQSQVLPSRAPLEEACAALADRYPAGAAIVFPWIALQRQVVVDGAVERLPDAEADEYFASRPHGSRLSAVASPQSQPLETREELERAYEEAAARYPDEVPRPEHWGGFRVRPDMVEFWQGRPDRLHDRLRYRHTVGEWIVERLAP